MMEQLTEDQYRSAVSAALFASNLDKKGLTQLKKFSKSQTKKQRQAIIPTRPRTQEFRGGSDVKAKALAAARDAQQLIGKGLNKTKGARAYRNAARKSCRQRAWDNSTGSWRGRSGKPTFRNPFMKDLAPVVQQKEHDNFNLDLLGLEIGSDAGGTPSWAAHMPSHVPAPMLMMPAAPGLPHTGMLPDMGYTNAGYSTGSGTTPLTVPSADIVNPFDQFAIPAPIPTHGINY